MQRGQDETAAAREPAFSIDGTRIAARPIEPGLYVVATPIGNLGDITLRALATLAAADLVACEDTRVTRVLTARYGIATPLIPYHEHNAAAQRPRLLAALAEGKAVALISDAGTPLVSDPGYRLVEAVLAAGHPVIPIPGASAVLAGLVASGLPTDTFLFAGFLPPKETGRRKRLAELAAVPGTLVFFESPQRLAASLADMAATLGGERRAAVARELTKAFERSAAATSRPLPRLTPGSRRRRARSWSSSGRRSPPRPPPRRSTRASTALLGEHGVRGAAEAVAAATGLPRRELYQRALALKTRGERGATGTEDEDKP